MVVMFLIMALVVRSSHGPNVPDIPSGRFAAHLVISLKDQKCIFPGRLSPIRGFDNMEDAVAYSASWGKAWIDDNE